MSMINFNITYDFNPDVEKKLHVNELTYHQLNLLNPFVTHGKNPTLNLSLNDVHNYILLIISNEI